jgi:phage shock protein PspC (stress-responsive transcriptional regulator)
MWAGVAGGLAEYFDIDPSLVRLIWVAAAVVSGGLAIPIYILAWIILPRDDRPPATSAPAAWRDWSQEFHDETHRLAEWSRQVAHDWNDEPRADTSPQPGASEPRPVSSDVRPPVSDRSPASDKGAPIDPPSSPPPAWMPPTESAPPDWRPPTDMEPHHHRPRSAGILLVGLGVLLLAANAGLFSMIEWRSIWPLIFIGLGLVLLVRQTGWFGR